MYQRLHEEGLVDGLLDRTLPQREAAKRLGVSQGAISKAVSAIKEDRAAAEAADEFERKKAEDPWPLHIDLYELSDDELHDLVGYFTRWRSTHFRDPKGKPYTTPSHQRRWLYLIFRAIRDGRCLLILSPPRHGKTELLIHIDTFLVTRVNPNIRIVKVCKSEGLAKKAVGSVLDQLSANDELIEECLPEGSEFKPAHGSRRPWNSQEFTTATRTVTGLKSPTMAAVGAGGTLLSRDGDVFSIDDIEDKHTVHTPEMRADTREWFATDLMSRKESGTAMIAIGSRQHPDDIWGHLIDNPNWDVVIERAHDDAECTIDPDDPEQYHRHWDCLLWPEVRDYEWLMEIKLDPERGRTYPMIYQNEEQDVQADVFTRELFDQCRDVDRVTGQYPKEPWIEAGPSGETIVHRPRLIAGLDPSATGFQATFLWAFDPAGNALWAVDYDNNLGGGIGRARQQIKVWYEQYGVTVWVIEENLYHGGIVQDELLLAYCQANGIQLIGHATQGNKWDEEMGVTALAKVMDDGRMSIPWGDQATQSKWLYFRKQLVNFSRDRIRTRRGRSKGISDIVMASWFPYETVKRWRKEWVEDQLRQELDDGTYPFVPADDLYTSFFPSMFSDIFAGA